MTATAHQVAQATCRLGMAAYRFTRRPGPCGSAAPRTWWLTRMSVIPGAVAGLTAVGTGTPHRRAPLALPVATPRAPPPGAGGRAGASGVVAPMSAPGGGADSPGVRAEPAWGQRRPYRPEG